MSHSVGHVAITVPDLQQAEAYYQALFEMESVTSERLGPDGERRRGGGDRERTKPPA